MKLGTHMAKSLALGLAFALTALTTSSRAESFPSKPVTIIVAAAAGGSSDITARAVAAGLQERWKQAVVVDNRAGANGLIAAQTLLKAPANGYTLMLGSIGQMMLNPIQHGAQYEPTKAYTMIGQVSKTYMVMVTSLNAPYQTLREYVEYAKKNPERGTFSSSGTGSLMHLAGERIRQQSGVPLTHVPYKGESPALVDLTAGTVAAGFVVAGTAVPLVNGGKLKALAISDIKRAPELSNTPTAVEQGYDVNMPVWNGLVAPSGLEPKLVAQINRDLNQVLASPATQEQLKKIGITAAPTTAQEFTKYVDEQSLAWKNLIKDGGINFQ
ncbi:tripartite tricarboxylate transporter substrate binding protein [Variovorax sp. efr-133-TYG-130]|uniref:Bug family tripartite tricarboxylate transporter substrate binding protein n=1 Tax=Variovorax sp. efr-133-TYG-130 TaxID=3040327 RepID=UPI0025549F3F|nr:tripartite tricarboxylate transporter substrate binding protein [Variovorax sp. efr-133-TYG-130]